MEEKFRNCYASLVIGHGLLPTIGLVVFNCESFEFKIYQYSDMGSYLKTLQLIQSHEITQVFIPKNSNESKIPIVLEIIQHTFKNITIFPFDRVYFNEERGVECIKQYGLVEDAQKLEPSFTSRYYGLSALAALFKYMEVYVKTFFPQNSVHIIYADPTDSMIIDPYTCTSLELLRDIDSASLKHSLFYAINNTSTKMGANRLKFNISQPLIDKATIETRYSCVEEMLYHYDTVGLIKKQLESCPDIDFIIKHVNNQTFSIKNLKQNLKILFISKNGIDLVDGLIRNLEIFKNQLLKNIHEELLYVHNSKLGLFLKEYLNDDIDLNDISRLTSPIYIIKYGINGLLDVARKTYTETIDDLHELVNEYKNQYSIAFQLKYISNSGYQIQVSKQNLRSSKIPDIFQKISEKNNTVYLTTLDILKLNGRIKNSLEEIYLMSNDISKTILSKVKQNIGLFYKLSQSISITDMMVSFTIYAAHNSLVRPIICENTIIKNSKQSVFFSCSKSNCTPNDISFSQNKNFSIITGPNMSGKTTYLKQIAHICIMAQIGCYIPAESGSIKLVTQMLSLFCHNPNYYSNSSFQQELNRIQYILNNMQEDSLVLIDEFGRNTSPEDSIGLLFAICEKLISSKAITFLSTHFMELSIYLMNHPNVNALRFNSEDVKNLGSNYISWDHKISNGIGQMKNYGINLAKQVGYKESFTNNASLISNEIKNHNKGYLLTQKLHKSRNKMIKYQQISEYIVYILKNSKFSKTEKIEQLNKFRKNELSSDKNQG